MTKKELLSMVGEAYPGAFPTSRAQARRHEVGDTLADFIYLELDETQSDEVDFDKAESVINTAISDLAQVLQVITLEHDKEGR